MIFTTDASPTFWHTTTLSCDLITPACFPWSSATLRTDSFVALVDSACNNNILVFFLHFLELEPPKKFQLKLFIRLVWASKTGRLVQPAYKSPRLSTIHSKNKQQSVSLTLFVAKEKKINKTYWVTRISEHGKKASDNKWLPRLIRATRLVTLNYHMHFIYVIQFNKKHP